jgi:SecD/SecF fusion protein
VSSGKPDETKSSSATPQSAPLPERRTRALVDDDSSLLALADAPSANQETKEAAIAQEEKQAAEQPVAGEEKKDLPARGSTPAAEEKPAQPAAKPEKAAAVGAEQTLDASTRFAGGTKASITTTTPIGHDHLEKTLLTAAEKVPGIDPLTIVLDLTAPGYEPGSDASFDEWVIQTNLSEDKTRAVLEQAQKLLVNQPFFPAANKIGAAVAATTQQQAAVAMVAALVLILAYIWFRFSQVMFGVAGVLAVVHDVLVTLGALALSTWLAQIPGLSHFLLIEPFKISLPIIAAFLTIIGYSLNDTIVIFDRIREVRGKSPVITAELANSCINQTLSRTILTSLTVFIVVLILYAVGGEGIHAFAFALVVGVVTGTYSTVYIATPIVLWMNRSAEMPKVRQAPAEQAVRERTSTA